MTLFGEARIRIAPFSIFQNWELEFLFIKLRNYISRQGEKVGMVDRAMRPKDGAVLPFFFFFPLVWLSR
jgi:hypothetical protein